jgi:hypothetical protein
MNTRHDGRRTKLLAALMFAVSLGVINASSVLADQRKKEWHEANALIRDGHLGSGLRRLQDVYCLTTKSSEPRSRKEIDENNILEEEFDPLRREERFKELRRALSAFARLANLHSQPRASSLPVMYASPTRFAIEELGGKALGRKSA